jgi:hypothetical protein
MKIRSGFVSNSSSCSFCVYKGFMSEKQMKEFRELLEKENHRDGDETYIEEDGDYFVGKLDAHNDGITDYMNRNFLRKCYGISY